MAGSNNCESTNWFDCDDKRQGLSLEQAFRLLFKKDANGCPAINIVGAVDTEGSPVIVDVTPSLLRDTGPGNVPAGAKSASFANAGSADALVNGEILKAGETVSYSVNKGEVLVQIDYDATGTELLIATTV